MDKIIKQLETGSFDMRENVIELESGVEIWAGNGWLNYSFYPHLNTKFTIREKWAMRKAIRQGLIAKATS